MITQNMVDSMYSIRFGHCGEYTNEEVINRIRSVLKCQLNIDISFVEAHNFWTWSSEQYDASFLSVHDDGEIIELFNNFIEEILELKTKDEPYKFYGHGS